MAETIFALSSGPGPSGVAVFRVSGSAVAAVVRVLTGRALPPARKAVLRRISDPSSGALIDRGLVVYFAGPDSFTGEDVAEFHLHGAVATIRQFSSVLMALPDVAAAEPGAFTRRAYQNGKLDLLEVEALSDLLAAETVEQARLAHLAARNLRTHAAQWRSDMLDALALTEASIDFSDEADIAEDIDSRAKQHIHRLIASLESALAGFARAERIRRGFRVALCGPPNAGKSSLLNALAQRDVAIVSPIAGTTRDVIEVHLDLGGYPVIVSDTAGIRDAVDPVEAIGVAKAQDVAAAADLVLWLSPVDCPSACPLPDALVLHTKSDRKPDAEEATDGTRFISVMNGVGIDQLVEMLTQRASLSCGSADGLLVAHARQAGELRTAVGFLTDSLAFGGHAPELRSDALRCALQQIDRLTGRVDPEEILGAIFSRFCIGK